MEQSELQRWVDQDCLRRRSGACIGAEAQALPVPARLTLERLRQWLQGGLSWEQRRVYWAELPGWNHASLAGVTAAEQTLQKSLERSERRWQVSCKQVDMNPDFLVDFQRKHVGDREPCWDDHCLTRDGIVSAMRVLELLQHTAHTSHFPMLVDIIPILLLVLTEKQVFHAVSEMMSQHDLYFAVSRRQQKVHTQAFRMLLRRVFPKTARDMERVGADTDEYLNVFFERFFVSLIPLPCVARILDEYLIDGLETVFRYAMGLFALHKRTLKRAQHDSAEAWWADFRSKLQQSQFDFRLLHAKAYSRIRSFTLNRESMAQLLSQAAEQVSHHEKHELPLLTPAKLGALAAGYSESDDTKLEVVALGSVAPSTVDQNEEDADVPPPSAVPFAQVLLNHSSLIRNVKQASRLLGWCPDTVRIKRPYLLFSSLEHGLSMHTMLTKMKDHAPFLLLVRTVKTGTVIGAYCPASLKTDGGVIGDGSSFVFRVSPPHAVYYWVLGARSSYGSETDVLRGRSNTLGNLDIGGLHRSESTSSLIAPPKGYSSASMTALHNRDFIDVRRLATSTGLYGGGAGAEVPTVNSRRNSIEEVIDIARNDTSSTLHQFALGTKTFLAFGASHSQGMNALRLTHDLTVGSSGPSDTFGNPCLVPEEDGTFDVDAVEVIGFRAT